MLAKVWNASKRHQQLLQLAHLLHGAVDEGAVRRQIDQEPDPADRLAICGAEPRLGGAGAAQDKRVVQNPGIGQLPCLQCLQRLVHAMKGYSYLAVDLWRRYPLTEDLVDVAHDF